MLKISFVAKDETKREAKRIASQDDSVVIDLRIVGTVITAILMISLIVSNIGLKRDYKYDVSYYDKEIARLEQQDIDKQAKIDSLEKQLKAEKEKTVEAAEEENNLGILLEEGIMDNTLYEYGLDEVSFMKFSKPINKINYQEDRTEVYHNEVLSNTENSSSGFEWKESPEEIEGCYLLVEMEHEWGYIPLDLNVKYNVSYREFMTWKNCYLVFQKMPEYAAITIKDGTLSYGFKDGCRADREIKAVGDGGYGTCEIEAGQYFANPSDKIEIELLDYNE